MINLLGNTPNQASKFRIKTSIETNDYSRGTYNTNIQIKFKNLMLKSSLCDYSDASILGSGNITVPNTGTVANLNHGRKKSNAPFTNFISEINNTQIDNTKGINVVMLINNLMEHSNNYSEASGSSW